MLNFDRLFIGGRWVEPAAADAVDVVSPTTGRKIGAVPRVSIADADAAIEAARAAYDSGPWPGLTPTERAEYLRKIVDGIGARRDELAHVLTIDLGLPPEIAQGHVELTISTGNVFVEAAPSVRTAEVRVNSSGKAHLEWTPVGVVLGIAPWNGPLPLNMLKLGAALVAGCPIVMKPAVEVPLSVMLMAEIIERADLPPGVVSVLPADREVSEHLVASPGIDQVSFTGSTTVGKEIMRTCADRVAAVTLELGGKSAMIVLDDADVEAAAGAVVPGACLGTGQVCSALTRVLISRKRHDEFVVAAARAMDAATVGDPEAPGTMVGPLATQAQFDKVLGYLELGQKEGATLVRGGARPENLEDGWFVEPTLFDDVDPSMRIAGEEIFGPIICVIAYDTVEEAIAIANDSRYGLHGAVFTSDAEKAREVAAKIRAGTFHINGVLPTTTFPYCGYKESGLGVEGDLEGIEDMRQVKQILEA